MWRRRDLPPDQLTVMSFNVRYDNKSEEHPEDLWPKRREHVAAIIEK
jgi:hypothetical protein